MAAGAVAAGGAAATVLTRATGEETALQRIEANDGLIGAVERQRRRAGASVKEIELAATSGPVDLGGRAVDTWSYDGLVPGREVRVRAGDVLRATVRNGLAEPTTVHWHGIALRNDMDGVPDLTQPAIAPGADFTAEFTLPDPGTYFFHPHVGTQLDRGLYAPLIAEDPSEPGAYDREFVIVLDDWLGVRRTPDEVLETLREGMGGMSGSSDDMAGMDMGGGEADEGGGPLGNDTGDVRYPMYLVNGHSPMDPATLTARPGERLRLRIINAGSDTPFRVALGGHRLTVTHADGFPVEPVEVDALLIGMGERYDVIATVPEAGAFPLVAKAEGTGMGALAVVRTGPGASPRPDASPAQLTGRLLALTDLHTTPETALPTREPDRTYAASLTGDMTTYRWGVEMESERGVTLPVRSGERVRLVLENATMMWHPLHLHGHTFQVVTGSGTGPRKDTVIVPAGARITLDVDADNPGQWVLHCHNLYHAESGMVTVLSYVT